MKKYKLFVCSYTSSKMFRFFSRGSMKTTGCLIVLAMAISCLLITIYVVGRPLNESDIYNNCRDGVVRSLAKQQPNNVPIIPIVPHHPEIMEYFDLINRIRELQRDYKEKIIKLSCSD